MQQFIDPTIAGNRKIHSTVPAPVEHKMIIQPAATIVLLFSSEARQILGGYKTCNGCGTGMEINAQFCGQCGLQLLTF